MQQKIQRQRRLEAYLRQQQEAEETERRRREYEAAARVEHERRGETELERRRQAELQRRRQAQQARGWHSMQDEWEDKREEKGSSVSTRDSPTPNPACSDTPTPDPTSTPHVPTPTAAESQPEPEEPQIDTAPSYAAVQSILSSFATLQSEFSFPTQPDFLPGLSPKLAYTPNNAPLHGYEHALTGLLTQLDGVESYGDSGVRKARKEAVKTIEKELERLDGMKAEAWKCITEPKPEMPEPVSVNAGAKVDPFSVPLPEDSDVEDEEMDGTLEELPTVGQPSEEPLAPAG
ncbi:hypothetical protein FRC11_003722, partial [Ceratobasidium sp. 423]